MLNRAAFHQEPAGGLTSEGDDLEACFPRQHAKLAKHAVFAADQHQH